MTFSKEELSGLVERVRGLNGPDREVDWRIADATNHPSFEKRFEHMWPPFGPKSKLDRDIPAYTASVDAALALVERVHPWNPWMEIKGCQPRKDGTPGALWIVTMDGVAECRAPTLPLAILLALLLSLQSQEPTL